jgi:methylmalonyl-CoA mutase, C-terminal domain
MIAAAARDEDVDVVALSSLSGAHMTLFPRVLRLVREVGRDDVLLVGGGIIDQDDVKALEAMGFGRIFGPGTLTREIAEYLTSWVERHRQRGGRG